MSDFKFYICLIAILAVTSFVGFIIAKKIKKILLQKEVKYYKAISIATGIISTLILIFGILVIIMLNVPWGR